MSSDTSKKQSREERLAEALRANLKRRKSQARARADTGPEDETEREESGSGTQS